MTTADTGGIAAEKLQSFVQRIERLEAEKAELAGDIREVYAEAKGNGFDTKIMRECIRLRKLEDADRRERDELIELYRRALGDLDGTPLGDAALTAAPPPRLRKRAPAGALESIRRDIADGKVSIEAGGVRIEGDGNGGVKSTPVHSRAGAGKLVEAVHDHLVAAGMVHEGGNQYRAPAAKDALPPAAEPATAPAIQALAPVTGNDDLAMPAMFAGATERQAAAISAARTEG